MEKKQEQDLLQWISLYVYAGTSKYPTLQFSISATSKFVSMKVINYGSAISIYDFSCFGPVHNFIEVKTIIIRNK